MAISHSKRYKPTVKENTIVNSVLAYVSFAIDGGTGANIQKADTGYFSLDEIVEAKDVLYAHHLDILGAVPQRKTSTQRTDKQAHCKDIVDSLLKLDNTKLCLEY